jgi:prepilin-type N-terminal cleavage/methylation domain-containing protein
MKPSRQPVRRAFTLIEMITSLVILGVLLAACASVVKMATQATGVSGTRQATQLQTAEAVSRMTDDLNVATNFTSRTSTAVTFTVPDRLNAGSPQSVTYSWAGTAGSPLLRRFNGGAAATLLPSVSNLSFKYTTRQAGPAATPAEQVVASHDTASGTFATYAMSDKNWGSQSFSPNLPIGTTSYTIKRVRLMLKTGSKDAVMTVALRLADGLGRPTGAVLAQRTVFATSFSTAYEWVEIPFDVSGLNPNQTICIVMSYKSGATSLGSFQIDQALLTILTTGKWSTSTDGGVTWSSGLGTTCGRFYVHATVP